MVTLADALDYLRRGWAVLPVKPGTKCPNLRIWECFQQERPIKAMVRKWFESDRHRNIGVILGAASGDLICREIQREAGDGPFYLGARTAGRNLGVDHTTAWRWLFLLQHEGILQVTIRGSASTRKASRYRYLYET